jgi:hypothetical protein
MEGMDWPGLVTAIGVVIAALASLVTSIRMSRVKVVADEINHAVNGGPGTPISPSIRENVATVMDKQERDHPTGQNQLGLVAQMAALDAKMDRTLERLDLHTKEERG